MTLSDMTAYKRVIGGLMYKPLLFLEYPDIQPQDFDYKPARVCLLAIKKLYEAGAVELSPVEIDQEIERCGGAAAQVYKAEGGLEFLKNAYEYTSTNFALYYNRLKKYSLLRKLQESKYDISEYYFDDSKADDPALETKLIQKIDDSSLEDILNTIERSYSEIRNNFLNGGHAHGDPAEGINELIDELKQTPSIGVSLEGKIFSSVCRGARRGCFFLKSASTSAGKSRTSIFDACHIAYPKHWSWTTNSFVEDVEPTGEFRPPRKVLFIVTEMDKEEVQTIMLAYLSGVDEDKILRGDYQFSEYTRVKAAAKIMEEYSGYFLIEEISDPNLQNVEATIRKYATVDEVEYVFFDYIHSTASMINQFSKNNLREDVILMLMANQLKQLAKDYGLFIFSATQVNALAMGDDNEMSFKDEKSIRGAKAIADKCDMGYVMTRIPDKGWKSVLPQLQVAAREGIISAEYITNPPTHILDIYKMRRGRYKMVRIWIRLHLGTGQRDDLFITTADNQPITEPLDLYGFYKTVPITIQTEEGDEDNNIFEGF